MLQLFQRTLEWQLEELLTLGLKIHDDILVCGEGHTIASGIANGENEQTLICRDRLGRSIVLYTVVQRNSTTSIRVATDYHTQLTVFQLMAFMLTHAGRLPVCFGKIADTLTLINTGTPLRACSKMAGKLLAMFVLFGLFAIVDQKTLCGLTDYGARWLLTFSRANHEKFLSKPA